MPPEQQAQPTALVDPDGRRGDAADNGSDGPEEWPAPTAPPIVAAPADTEAPAAGRRQRREERERHTTRGEGERVEARAAARSERVRRDTGDRPVKLTRAQKKAQYRLRARKVQRIVRRVDAWAVLKVSFVFYLCLYVVALVAGIVLWRVADSAGAIENIESTIEDMGAFETFQFEPDLILRGTALIGAVLTVVVTGLTVLAAVLFNLISDLVGGIRMTVIEEDGARPLGRERKPKPARPKR